VLILPIGKSIIKTGIGVTILEGIPVDNIGLNLNIPPTLIFSIELLKEVGPCIKLPASLVVVIELGPDAI